MSQSLWNSFFIWEWMYSCVWIALWHRKFLSRNSSRRNAPEEPPGAIHSPIAMVGDRYGTWTRIGVGKSAAATVGTLNIAVSQLCECSRRLLSVHDVQRLFWRDEMRDGCCGIERG